MQAERLGALPSDSTQRRISTRVVVTVGIGAAPVRLRNAALPRDCGRTARLWSSKPATRVRLPPVAPNDVQLQRAGCAANAPWFGATPKHVSKLSLVDSAAPSKRKRVGSMPAGSARAAFDYWLGREVLNLEERDRYSHAAPCLCRRIRRPCYERGFGDGSTPSRDTTPSPRDFGGDAPNVARRGSTPREGSPFWDRLTVGRELLELAIVVRLHGPEPTPSEHSW